MFLYGIEGIMCEWSAKNRITYEARTWMTDQKYLEMLIKCQNAGLFCYSKLL